MRKYNNAIIITTTIIIIKYIKITKENKLNILGII